VQQRREEPADDVLTVLVRASLDGRPLTDQEIVELCMTIISGGFVTTTALTAHALLWLSQHRDERRRLTDDVTLLPAATEELLRIFSPAQSLARTVTRDVEIGGRTLRAGDRVLLSWAGANRDPEVFEEPDAVRLDRQPNRHAAFGFGIHRCIGNSFARAEFAAMLRQVLSRLPDYEVDVAATRPYPSVGVINGVISMPATFTPGPVIGRDRDLIVPKRRSSP
jgi:cytochrome P450